MARGDLDRFRPRRAGGGGPPPHVLRSLPARPDARRVRPRTYRRNVRLVRPRDHRPRCHDDPCRRNHRGDGAPDPPSPGHSHRADDPAPTASDRVGPGGGGVVGLGGADLRPLRLRAGGDRPRRRRSGGRRGVAAAGIGSVAPAGHGRRGASAPSAGPRPQPAGDGGLVPPHRRMVGGATPPRLRLPPAGGGDESPVGDRRARRGRSCRLHLVSPGHRLGRRNAQRRGARGRRRRRRR